MEKVKKIFRSGDDKNDQEEYDTSSPSNRTNPSDGLSSQPIDSSGTGGGITDSTGSYGAARGTGISSYTDGTSRSEQNDAGLGSGGNTSTLTGGEPSTYTSGTTGTTGTGAGTGTGTGIGTATGSGTSDISDPVRRPFAKDTTSEGTAASSGMPGSYDANPTATSGVGSSAMPGAFDNESSRTNEPITQNTTQLGSSSAPQVGNPDLGDRFDAGNTMGTGSSSGRNDAALGTSALGAGAGVTGASLADRSHGTTTTDPNAPGTTNRGTELGDSTSTGMGRSTGTGIGSSTGTAIGSSSGTSTGMGSSTGTGMGRSTGTGMGNSTGTAMGSSTGTGMGSSTGTGMGSSTGTGMGNSTGTAMGTSTGTAMGSSTGTGMGSSTDTRMGSSTGAGTGSSTGTGLGSTTGDTIGTAGAGQVEQPYSESSAEGGAIRHSTFTGNRLDPRTNEEGPFHTEPSEVAHGRSTGTGGNLVEGSSSSSPPYDSSISSTGRDAGMVGGSSGTGFSTSRDPYGSSSQRTGTDSQGSGSHFGRDAAIAGGAGVGGAGAYEGLENRGTGSTGTGTGLSSDPTDTGPASKTIGPHSSNLKNILDPRVLPDSSKQSSAAKLEREQQASGSHLGRDAAIGGGAGVAGAGAYEAYENRNPNAQQKTGTTAPTFMSSNTQPSTTTTTTSSTTQPGGAFPSESATRPTGTSQAYDDKSTSTHTGRDAAVGGLAVAGGGLGYEAARRTDEPSYRGTDGATGHSESGTSTGTGTHTGTNTSSHTGRDAAIGGGALAAGGAGVAGASTFDHNDSTSATGTHGTTTTQPKEHHSMFHHDKTSSSTTHGDSTGAIGTTGAAGATGGGLGSTSAADSKLTHGNNTYGHGSSRAIGGTGVPPSGTAADGYPTTEIDEAGASKKSRAGDGLVERVGGGLTDRRNDDAVSPSHGHGSDEVEGKEKRSLVDRILHRDSPNKLHKDPPS